MNSAPLRRWWMAGDVRPALQTPDNYKCQPGLGAAGSSRALRATPASTADLSPRCGIGKGAGEAGQGQASGDSSRFSSPGGYPPRVAVWPWPLAWNVAQPPSARRTGQAPRRGAWPWGRGCLSRVNATGEATRPGLPGATSAEGRCSAVSVGSGGARPAIGRARAQGCRAALRRGRR